MIAEMLGEISVEKKMYVRNGAIMVTMGGWGSVYREHRDLSASFIS